MKKILLALMTSAAAFGISPSQIACTAPAGKVMIMVALPPSSQGVVRFRCVQLDNSIVLDTSTNPATLRSVAPQSGPSYADAETPAGAIDGANRTYTLARVPTGLMLFRNGVLQKVGVDFSIVGSTVTFIPEATPETNDVIVASYRY